MDRLITWTFIAAVLALGAWGADRKRAERESSPPTYSSPLMMCTSKIGFQAQRDCLYQHGLEGEIGADPKDEPRRK